LNTTDFGLFS